VFIVFYFQNAELKFNFGDTPFKHPPQVGLFSQLSYQSQQLLLLFLLFDIYIAPLRDSEVLPNQLIVVINK